MSGQAHVIHKFMLSMGENIIDLEPGATFLYAAADSREHSGAVWVQRPAPIRPRHVKCLPSPHNVKAKRVYVAATGDTVPPSFKRPLGLIRLGEFIFHAFAEE